MTTTERARYGTWRSPITTDMIVAQTISLGQIATDGDDLYWLETRPAEAGRSALVRRSADGRISDVTPMPFNARTRVHEYGGGAYVVDRGTLIFSNFADNRLYRIASGGKPQPITASEQQRFADLVLDRQHNRLICVREDHRESDLHPINTIVALPLDGEASDGEILISGNDFYMAPRLSPDGSRLAWITWNQPDMSWDSAELWIGDVQADGAIGEPRRIAGGPRESAQQPRWGADGSLYFMEERTGWWNLYRWRDGEITALCPTEAEWGEPLWVFGARTYDFAGDDSVVAVVVEQGVERLYRLDLASGERTPIDTPYGSFAYLNVAGDRVYCLASAPDTFAAVVSIDMATGDTQAVRRSSEVTIDPGYLSTPQPIAFPTEGGRTAHAFFYPPQNRSFAASADERPPLIVISHGGPTGATNPDLRLSTQFWTSRGFGVVDVNYGGSTGYGREYRERLQHRWGIVDVQDCINAARYLVDQGLADGDRLIIRGGSAGGYTTLAALAFHDVFKAGASHFGISDLEVLNNDSHKMEAQYNHSLIGPYPERRDLYLERSPIYAADRLSCPLILFQGLDDKIVTPNQSEVMFDSVKAKGLPVAYVAFEGEGHGFRRAENIKRSLEAELYFYGRVFGFDPADEIDPVPIENLAD